jgi:hypothetical protein
MHPTKYDITACRRKASGGGSKKIPPAKIEAWVKKNFDYKERKEGEELVICSPFTSSTSAKFNINPEKASCHDWSGDEWAGPINPQTGKRNCSFIKFVKLFRKCSYADALREVLGTSEDLKSYLRPENRHSTAEAVRTVLVALPDGTERLSDNETDPQAKIITKWLIKRGYSEADISKHDIHYLGVDCYWPYYEFDSLVYWQSRNRFNKIYRFPDETIFDRSGKVVGKTEGTKGEFLYGFDDCELASYVIVTESIFGQYTLGEQALASGGAALTLEQIGKLKIIGPRKGIILSPDNDKAGVKSIIANHSLLKMDKYPLYYSIPPRLPYEKDGETKYTKDWNEIVEELKVGREEVRQLHDKRIKPLNIMSLNELHRLVG